MRWPVKTPLERLLSKTLLDEKTGCLNWVGVKLSRGYGKFVYDGSEKLAHRASYELNLGPIPHGLYVLHKCDNPSCINPEHLFVGTQADNMADKVAKSRQSKGLENGRAKLSEQDIRAIRASVGVSQETLAKRFGTARSQISRIQSGENWSHLSEG